MRKINKSLIFTLCIIMLFTLIGNVSLIKADTVKNDDGTFNYTTTNETTTEIISGVNYIKNTGYTTRNSEQYDQRVTIFTADFSQKSDIKIATWCSLNDNGTGFTRKALLDIAKDYEANNPGWVVLAGINADQYYQLTGTKLGVDGSCLYQPQSYYPMSSNGENWFLGTPYGFSSNTVGFKNDGSSNPLVNGTRTTKGFYIHIYDENNQEIASYPIDGLNCELGENKTVVLSSYKTDATSSATITRDNGNDIYVVSDADLSFVSCTTAWKEWNPYAVDAFFGKGKISEVVKSVTLKGDNSFAIETTNEELKKVLSVGTYIKVQLEYDDEFSGIEEAMGYHTVQRKNGVDQQVANGYNSRPYPRSVVGCDKDGKVYLMTCFGDNGSPTKGLYAQEINAVCKKYGITDAYQMDGGGSVTSIVRNENGQLEYAEACIEASSNKEDTYSGYRYVLSGLFIVMKVPEASVSVTSKACNSVTLDVDTSKLVGNYEEASLIIKDTNANFVTECQVELEETKSSNVISSLTPNTSYYYELRVNDVQTFISGEFNTLKEGPTIKTLSSKMTENGLEVTIEYEDTYQSMTRLYAWFGNKKYSFNTNNGKATIILKEGYSIFDMKVVADCLLDTEIIKHTDVELEINQASYAKESFFSYPALEIESFIQKFFE